MAMTDGEVTYASGFCPAGYSPFCCAVVVSPLFHGWGVTYAYIATGRLLTDSTPAAAFQLKLC